MTLQEAGGGQPSNHPQAVRMGIIAFVAHNVVVGAIFGTTGVLLRPMAERLGVTLELASAGAPMVIVGSALLSSIAGVLAARFSLRALLAASAVAMAVGWFLLGATQSFVVYLIAYGACLGPAMAIGGAVLPPTLVTRWFTRHRGLAIGLTHMSVVVAIMPVASNWLIETYGLNVTFYALAAFALLTLLPAALLLQDYPPDHHRVEAGRAAKPSAAGGASLGTIVGAAVFWMLAIAIAAPNTSSILLGVHLVTMAETWGFTRGQGAALASVMALAGIGGFVLFGWISDKLGGARTIALLAFDSAALWALLLLDLPFAGLAVVIGLIGLHGAGSVPALSKAIGEVFGQESFSRAYGMSATVTLPIMVLAVIGTGVAARMTGGYAVVVISVICFYIAAFAMAMLAAGRGQRAVALSPA
ncbi:MFS transporter [Novosphingobium sp. M1R2S20]|uniref:MFS transporter n=1 Tax=Novosphingobium rhizovicinum TaxID=3228928 RepID=A0ABV3RDV0_9SPHN